MLDNKAHLSLPQISCQPFSLSLFFFVVGVITFHFLFKKKKNSSPAPIVHSHALGLLAFLSNNNNNHKKQTNNNKKKKRNVHYQKYSCVSLGAASCSIATHQRTRTEERRGNTCIHVNVRPCGSSYTRLLDTHTKKRTLFSC